MANLIIKPTDGGSLILQDEGGTAAHTIDASGNHTLSGTTNNLGTVTAGTLSSSITYPAGHVIKTSTTQVENPGAHVAIASTSFVDSGIEVTHVAVESSANSYLRYEFYSGMFYFATDGASFQLDTTMRTVSNSTYTAAESICSNDWGISYSYIQGASQNYFPILIRANCGLVSGMGMPATKSSWAAGDTLYFRLYGKRSSGNAYVAHDGIQYNATVTEVKR